jgi:phosphatidylglycerol lysyltransferase
MSLHASQRGDSALSPQAPTVPDWQLARDLVLCHGWNTMAYQILNPGIRLWFSRERDAVAGYVDAGGYRVVAGAPIGPSERLAAIVGEFEDDVCRRGLRVCYFGSQARITAIVAARACSAQLLLGAQPAWHPGEWPAIVDHKASLRAQVARARNKGVVVREWPSETASDSPLLRECLREWLSTRGLPPMHFVVEPQTLGHLHDRRVFVALRGERVAGFLIATPIPLRHGWLIEQIVRGRSAPNGTSELLIDAAMRALASEGAGYVTLGLAPLSRRSLAPEGPQPPWIQLLLQLVRTHGRRFYNFDGLDTFKAKLQPESWEPVFALTHERWVGLRALYAIAGAFGGESPVLFLSRAALRAGVQELRWLGQRLAR